MKEKEDQTPLAARPTPITDDAAIALHGTRLAPGCIYVKAEDMRNLERQLAESKSGLEAQRELIALQRGEIDKLRDKIAKWEHEVDRLRAAVDESNIAELNRQIGEVTRERDELAGKFTKLDKPKYSGLPMLDEVLAKPNPEFSAWVASLPATYWTRYDLSAARIGWEAAKTWNQKP